MALSNKAKLETAETPITYYSLNVEFYVSENYRRAHQK